MIITILQTSVKGVDGTKIYTFSFAPAGKGTFCFLGNLVGPWGPANFISDHHVLYQQLQFNTTFQRSIGIFKVLLHLTVQNRMFTKGLVVTGRELMDKSWNNLLPVKVILVYQNDYHWECSNAGRINLDSFIK